jgi:hypothetical protein
MAADYRIESKLTLPPDVPSIIVQIGEAEITVSNSSQKDSPNESLAAQILVLADDIGLPKS